METDPAQVAVVVAKRQAPELTADCMVYRYGSLATSVEVVRKSTHIFLLWQLQPQCIILVYNWNNQICFYIAEGIESVEIVQMSNVISMETEVDQNAVDVTITCQGR